MKTRLRRRTLGIQARLTMLALAAALPLVGLASFAILRNVDDQRVQIERDLKEGTQTLLAALDRQISSTQAALQVLALSPCLQTNDIVGFDRHLRAALKVRGTTLVLHDATGQQLINTNKGLAEPLPGDPSGLVARVVETRKPQISDLITEAVLRQPIVSVGVPVFRDGEVAFVVAMEIGPEILSALLKDLILSPDWRAAIIDRKGIMVARSQGLGRSPGRPVEPLLQTKMADGFERWFPNVTRDGIAVYTTLRRSAITGWTVAIEVPRALVDAPLRQAEQFAFGGGAAVLALSFALAWWVARAIRRPVDALTTATRALGSGVPLDPPAGGVREFDQVDEALRSTALALEQRAHPRETAAAALCAGERRFRTLAQSLPQLVWTCLPDGRCDYLSRQWLDYTGMADGERLDLQRLKQVIHPDDFAATVACWTAAVKELGNYNIEHRIRAADGHYGWFMTRGTPVRDAAGHIVEWFGTCTDIEDIIDARESLARSREELANMVEERTRELAATNEQLMTEIRARELAQSALVQCQKIEAVGQLTGGIAHDFNNLLTAISGSLELLETRVSDEKSLRLVRTAQHSAARGAKLTEYLLAFASKQRLEPEPADLNAIVLEMSEMLRHSLGASVEIRHVLAKEPWPVLIDVNQIEAALMNVASNARDAMPDGGTLLIETANIAAGDSALPHEVADHDCVLVSLRDTGTGMSPEVVEHAFEPFFTTKGIGKGTGLGLSMVFGVVRQSGGAVRLWSRLCEGTTVQVYLPRALEVAARRGEKARPAGPNGSARILMVDDEPTARWITAECLRQIGHVVEEADSGRAALAVLERGEPYDLMLVDLVMPGLSGLDTARLARCERPSLRVLFCTGADTSRFTAEIGDDPLLKKPFKPETLADAVRTALEQAPPTRSGEVVPLQRGGPPRRDFS